MSKSTSTIYFNKRRLSWKEYKWWELALNWFIPCSNKKNVSSLSCLICKYAEHPAPDSTSLIKPCTEQSARYFILMKIHDDDFRLQTFRVGTMCFSGDETPPVTGRGCGGGAVCVHRSFSDKRSDFYNRKSEGKENSKDRRRRIVHATKVQRTRFKWGLATEGATFGAGRGGMPGFMFWTEKKCPTWGYGGGTFMSTQKTASRK